MTRLNALMPVVNAPRPSTVGGVLATQAPGSLSALKTQVRSGVVSNVPFEALINSQQYRRGELDAKAYVGRVLGDSAGFASWTLAGTAAGAVLSGLGLPALAVGIGGFAFGMLGLEIWQRTVGPSVNKGIAAAVPEAIAKPAASLFTRFIANPINDWIWKPVSGFIKNHKLISLGVAGLLALKFPGAAKALGGQGLLMGGGLLGGMGLVRLLDKVLPAKAKPEAQGALKDLAMPLDDRTRGFLRQKYASAFDWQGEHPQAMIADYEKAFFVQALAERETDPSKAQELSRLASELQARLTAHWAREASPAEPPQLEVIPAGS